MNYWLFFIPLFAAFAGWCSVWVIIQSFFYPKKVINIFGLKLYGILYKYKNSIIDGIAVYAAKQFSFTNLLEEKINNPKTLEGLMPLIEDHIDDFLRKKLAEQIPMISMLIGEKTIIQLKSIFIKELKDLFPSIIKNYMNNLSNDFNIEKLIKDKLNNTDTNALIHSIKQKLSKQFLYIQLTGFIIGLVIGIIEMFLFNNI